MTKRWTKAYYSCTYLDLSLHGDAEECDKVHDKDWPEHRDVKALKECAHCCNNRRFTH